MIQMQTSLEVADNSGAKRVQCIKILGGSKHMIDGIGAEIIVSVKEAIPNSKVKKGDIARAVIVRSKFGLKRNDGTKIKFDSNAVVIINDKGEPVGTRIFGPVTRELRQKKYMKIVSLAPEVL